MVPAEHHASTTEVAVRQAEQAAAVDRLFQDAYEVRPSAADCDDPWTDRLLGDPGSADSLAAWLSEALSHPGVGPVAGIPSAWQPVL